MRQVLFAKYNRTRKLNYQISTLIYEENGKALVEKKALCREAIPHIESLKEKSERLDAVLAEVSVLVPEISGKAAVYEYIDGITLEERLFQFVQDKDGLIKELERQNERIFAFSEGCVKEFEKTELFTDMFGELEGVGGLSVKTANIDCLYDNFIEKDGKLYCLDCEWVVETTVPIGFLKYRSLYYFYSRYRMYLEHMMTEEEFLEQFGISAELASLYAKMEDSSQHYIHGKNRECIYTDQYKKAVKSRDKLEEEGFDIESYKQLQEKDKDITALNELCHIKDQTISDKDQYIADLEAIISKMRANPLYKAGRAPVKAVKIIGGLLQKKKAVKEKLCFEYADTPDVSIVIPVYNQFDYTWKCLKSIKEYTKDVSYEVIIADDASTDSVKRLLRLTQNLVISRNDTNLGFLKNCNKAAEKARGRYILFLNNDTTVTPGWLSSLTALLDQDGSIGLAGSKLVYPNGILQEAGGVIWSNGDGWNYGRNDLPDKPEYQYVKEADYVSGASMIIRTALWKQLGGFDERFAPAYYEDTDLAFSVRRAGYRVVFEPRSVVIHYEGISNGTDTSGGLKRYQEINKEAFREKWKEELKNQYDTPDDLFLARDRSRNKKLVLFIDRYVPQYDKDAGSKSTLSYIKAFLKMGYQVKFLPEDFKRDEVYAPYLEALGVEVLGGSWYVLNIEKWIADYGRHFSVIFACRPLTTGKFIEILKKHSPGRLLYYGHDLHYLRELKAYEVTGDKSLLPHANQMKVLEYAVMRQADMVYYPSFLEIEEIKREDGSIKAEAIPVYVYEEPYKAKPLPVSDKKNLIFVGGFAHEPNVDAVIWFCRDILPAVAKEIPEAEFHIIGSNPPKEVQDLASDHVKVRGFVTEEELSETYRTARLAVVPLRFGAGMKGKVIEAIYHRTPLVTTSIGAQGLTEYAPVMAVEDEAAAFADRVISLYRDEEKLTAMNEASPAYIEKYFSLEAAGRILEKALGDNHD